jgi:hypothetical protein
MRKVFLNEGNFGEIFINLEDWCLLLYSAADWEKQVNAASSVMHSSRSGPLAY